MNSGPVQLGLVDLLDELPGPTLSELQDPGLHPDVQFFVSNFLTGYLGYAPGRINALVSAYALTHSSYMAAAATIDLPHARAVFLDSGAFTPLVGCAKGTATREAVLEWTAAGPDIVVALAHKLAREGVAEGVVASLDLPSYQPLLDAAGLTVAEAEAISVKNAEIFLGRPSRTAGDGSLLHRACRWLTTRDA